MKAAHDRTPEEVLKGQQLQAKGRAPAAFADSKRGGGVSSHM